MGLDELEEEGRVGVRAPGTRGAVVAPLDEQSWLVSQARCWEGGGGFGVDSPRSAPRRGWVVRTCMWGPGFRGGLDFEDADLGGICFFFLVLRQTGLGLNFTT